MLTSPPWSAVGQEEADLAADAPTSPAEAAALEDGQAAPASAPESDASLESLLAELFRLAGEGDPDACVQLGSLYEQGTVLTRNYGEALHWYRTAANLNSDLGNYNTGICFEVGMGTAPDPVAALGYFERAANLGLAQAMYKCAHYYLDGLSGVRDDARALAYLTRAAEAGHGTAANDLGLIYASGLLGQTRDERKAVTMFILGADLGNPEAMKNIGVSFHQGIGRSPSNVKALKWFIAADHYGYPTADLSAELRRSMSEADIAAAQAEAEEWIADHEAGRPTQ